MIFVGIDMQEINELLPQKDFFWTCQSPMYVTREKLVEILSQAKEYHVTPATLTVVLQDNRIMVVDLYDTIAPLKRKVYGHAEI